MKKQNCLSKRAIWTRYVIVGLLLVTAVLDFITFVANPKYWVFDMSPLVAITKNVAILFGIKFLVIGAISYLLLHKMYTNDYANYLWIMCAVYLIFAQGLGSFNNQQVAAQDPDPSTAPPPVEMAKIGFNFALLYAYYPIIFSMLSFWMWQWGWRLR